MSTVSLLGRFGVVVIDQFNEKSISNDILLDLLKQIANLG